MSFDPVNVAAILLMALASYALRATGLVIADRLAFEGRAKAAFDAIPAAVLTAVIAPTVLVTGPAESIAGALAILAAVRLPLIGTVAVGVVAVVVLRAVAG
jgi:uncharacterized membrane protein